MSKPSVVYVTYIRASREEVWKGLTEPEFTRQYWLHEWVSDWKVGSRIEHVRNDESKTPDVVGELLEYDQPNRLTVSWVAPKDEGNPTKTSKVTFELKDQEFPMGTWTQLTISHTELEPDSEMYHSVGWGWPAVGSGLKTLLETGEL